MKKDIAGLGISWDGLTLAIGLAWDRLKVKYPILQDIENWAKRMAAPDSPLLKTRDNFAKLTAEGLKSVWEYLTTKLMPDLGTFAGSTLVDVLMAIGDVVDIGEDWFDILFKIGEILAGSLWDALFGDEGLGPKLGWLLDTFLEPFRDKIAAIGGKVEALVQFFKDLKEAIKNLPLDKLLIFIGHSPAPLAVGINSINKAMDELASRRLPELKAGLTIQPLASRPLVQPSFGGAGFAPGLAGVGADQSVNVSIQGVTINNGMDLAYFEDRVSKAVTRSTRNG